MTHFRLRFIQRGNHTHVSMFAGKAENLTHGKCGDFSMTNEEWNDFRYILTFAGYDPVRHIVSEIELIDNDQEGIDNGQFGVGA